MACELPILQIMPKSSIFPARQGLNRDSQPLRRNSQIRGALSVFGWGERQKIRDYAGIYLSRNETRSTRIGSARAEAAGGSMAKYCSQKITIFREQNALPPILRHRICRVFH